MSCALFGVTQRYFCPPFQKKIMKNLKMRLGLVSALVLGSGGAMAAIDPAVTTAIATAQTDSLALAGVLTAMVAVIWGVLFLKKKFFG